MVLNQPHELLDRRNRCQFLDGVAALREDFVDLGRDEGREPFPLNQRGVTLFLFVTVVENGDCRSFARF